MTTSRSQRGGSSSQAATIFPALKSADGEATGIAATEPVEAAELERRLARRIAEETARLMRQLDEIEDRLDLVERALKRPRGR
jgi:hypothetical protein